MYYEILVNGASLGVFGHDRVRNMHLSLQVLDEHQDVFASAVCEEDGLLYLFDWLQHAVRAQDTVQFRRVDNGPSQPPRMKRLMRSAMESALPPPTAA